jgi:hypothetical protein
MSNYFTRGWDYIRNADGSHWYSQFKKGQTSYLGGQDKLQISLKDPVVAACMQIRSNLLSKVMFYQEIGDERVTDTEWIHLINNPNPLQSKQDCLNQYEYYRLAYGWVYQRPYNGVGAKIPAAVYNLNPKYIEFPQEMKSPIIFTSKDEREFFEQKFTYDDPEFDSKNIEFKDVMMYFDIANGLNEGKASSVTSPSRLESVIKSVSNIGLGLDAENTIIQTNGRELFSQDSKGGNLGIQLPMDKDDRADIDNKLINNYNVSAGRRSITTSKPVDWTNISMKLKDLGFVESGANNATYITQMYQVPNKLYAAHMKGNSLGSSDEHRDALIGMYEGVIQPIADDYAATWTAHFGLQEQPIKASFEHVPVMQHIEQQKADKLLKISTAYRNLVLSGVEQSVVEELFRGQGIELNQE